MSSPNSKALSQKRMSSVRASPAPRTSLRVPASDVSRTSVRMSSARNNTTQPTYDFLAGGSGTPPRASREPRNALRHSQTRDSVKPDPANEQLRAEIKALQYELSAIKSDRELVDLRHENELREVQNRAEEDFRKAQAAEAHDYVASHKYESLVKQLHETQDQASKDKQELEQKVRRSQNRAQSLEEELEEAQTELSSKERQAKHQLSELDLRFTTLLKTSNELRDELQEKSATLQTTHDRLIAKEREVGELEGEILRLKAQNGDADTLGVIKRELSEQVAHIKHLESANRDQNAELKHYRKLHKSVEVVEEEKRVLEGKVRMMDDLRRELSEAQLQKQILLDERKSWTAYLEDAASSGNELGIWSPEDMARALSQERLKRTSLLEKLGNVELELVEKDEIIKSLETDLLKIKAEADKLKSGGGHDPKKLARVERQKVLAIKEVEYLREQLKTFDTEETTFQSESFDAQKVQRITELESIIDQYRQEVATLMSDLSKQEALPVAVANGTKRPREEEPDERLGQLSRKIRKLQDDNSNLQQAYKIAQSELSAQKSILESQTSTSRTRILELRSNPTAIAEAVKTSTLQALKSENAALLAQLEGQLSTKMVPVQTLENTRRDLADMEKVVAEKEKRMMRLKQIWSSKSLEFREAVASVLGWKMDFMPNGRVKVTSMFYPSSGTDGGDGPGGDENSIIFDGEQGTMKISGGPKSLFALEIKEMIKFWVEGRKEIPCFLAACTLEFYEKTTRAARM